MFFCRLFYLTFFFILRRAGLRVFDLISYWFISLFISLNDYFFKGIFIYIFYDINIYLLFLYYSYLYYTNI